MHIIEDRPLLWPYILLSVLFHALMVALMIALRAVSVPTFAEKPIEIVPIVEQPSSQAAYRIADIAEPEKQERPKQAKFLGMYDSTVSQESVATVKRPGKSGEGTKRAAPKPRFTAPREQRPKGTNRLLAFDPSLFGGKATPAPEREKSGGDGGSLDDFYPDFNRGARTYLNVLRYPEVEYFVRLKRSFKMTFNPEPPLRDYFAQNRVTRGSIDVVLGVSVDKMGNLAELFIFRSSGIPSYDSEALRTVRASAPFATPPAKFTDNDGMLRMSWTFSVYL